MSDSGFCFVVCGLWRTLWRESILGIDGNEEEDEWKGGKRFKGHTAIGAARMRGRIVRMVGSWSRMLSDGEGLGWICFSGGCAVCLVV